MSGCPHPRSLTRTEGGRVSFSPSYHYFPEQATAETDRGCGVYVAKPSLARAPRVPANVTLGKARRAGKGRSA